MPAFPPAPVSHPRAARPSRQVVADAVLADPAEWSEAVLGKPPAEYCRWIKASTALAGCCSAAGGRGPGARLPAQPASWQALTPWPSVCSQDPLRWGGAIELAILAGHLGREIAAFDIQTTRVDIYGQGAGYAERLMVIYDGAALCGAQMVHRWRRMLAAGLPACLPGRPLAGPPCPEGRGGPAAAAACPRRPGCPPSQPPLTAACTPQPPLTAPRNPNTHVQACTMTRWRWQRTRARRKRWT